MAPLVPLYALSVGDCFLHPCRPDGARVGPRRLNPHPPTPNRPPAPASQNFLISIFDAQYDAQMTLSGGSETRLGDLDYRLNILFTFAFAIELLVNIYAHWQRSFLINWWNWCAAPRVGELFSAGIVRSGHFVAGTSQMHRLALLISGE